MKKVNVGLIWANPHSGNLGVAALAYSSLFLLEKISKKKNIKFIYTVFGGTGPKHDILEIGEHKIEITNSRFDYNGSFKSIVKLFLFKWSQISTFYKLDIIFDIGGGDSFADIYGMQRFRGMNASKGMFHFMGKRQVLLPQTIGPFASAEAKKKAKTSIKNTYLVLARDKQSFDYVTDLVPQKKVYELIDVAFFMPYKPIDLKKNKVNVGINISGLLWKGGYTKDNQFNLKSDYRDLMTRIINYFLRDNEIEVYLVGHVISPNYESIENDLKVCDELNKLYPKTIVAPAFRNPIEAKSFISALDFFTGARMHACIASFSSGVPVYPLAYSRKFNGLFEDTLKYKYYGDLVNADADTVFNGLVSAYNNRDELKSAINSRKDFLLERESQLVNLLSDAIPIK